MLSGYVAAFVAYLNHGDTREIESYVESAGNLDYLKVYRNGYLKTCVDALSQNYPTLLAVVGNDYFQILARHYVEEYPPERHTLVGYGESFPAFVDETREHHGLGYLSDFARLDHAWLASYFSADESPLTSEQVSQDTTAGHDIAAFTPRLCNHANLVQLRHAVVGVWVELREKKQLTTQIELKESAQTVLLWREEQRINARALSEAEARFLYMIEQGDSLGTSAASALERDSEFDVADHFASLLQHGILGRG